MIKINLVRRAARMASKVPKPRGLAVVVRRDAGEVSVWSSIRGKPFYPDVHKLDVIPMRRIVGEASFSEGKDPVTLGKALIGHNVFVPFAWRRRGVGRAMTIAAMRQTKSYKTIGSAPWQRLADKKQFAQRYGGSVGGNEFHQSIGFKKAMEAMRTGPRGGVYKLLPSGQRQYVGRKAFRNLPRAR